jgi:catechol 2,3-dioxygenase-like lactoylglutathione lyase family enzyme
MTVLRVVPIVTVPDVEASASAMTRTLGMTEVMNHGWIVTLAKDTNQISIMSKDATAEVNPTMSVEVDDVDAAYEQAGADGLKIVHPFTDEEWGVRRFFFADGSGNVVNVLSHRG